MSLKRQNSSFSSNPIRDGLLAAVIVILVCGSLVIAVLDPSSRPAFIDLAKVAVAGYLGWMVPRPSIGG
jgi:hypothetical protein